MTISSMRKMYAAVSFSTLARAALFAGAVLSTACSSDSASNQNLDDSNSTGQEQFLAANAARPGVSVTDSGLQYEVLRAADGARPDSDSVITVNYIGELIDGTVFDNSYTRGEPTTFNLSGTIDGWVEGVQLMSVGSQYRLVIPADLAYGDRGAGAQIRPGNTLIFEIELLEINSN